jgi:hypothetical protein
MSTIVNDEPTKMTREKAIEVKKQNQEQDPDWTYYIAPFFNSFIISVFDDDDKFVGFL